MMFLNKINYVSYWKRMLECSKNVFTEIPLTLLEFKKNCQILQKSFKKLHKLLLLLLAAVCKAKLISKLFVEIMHKMN